MARSMRAAFHLANLIFFCVSASGVSQMLMSWKNVAAASKVSAVCLFEKSIQCQLCFRDNPGEVDGWKGDKEIMC